MILFNFCEWSHTVIAQSIVAIKLITQLFSCVVWVRYTAQSLLGTGQQPDDKEMTEYN